MKKLLIIPAILFFITSCSETSTSNESNTNNIEETSSMVEGTASSNEDDGPCRTNCIEQRNRCLDLGGNTQVCDDQYDACVGRCD